MKKLLLLVLLLPLLSIAQSKKQRKAQEEQRKADVLIISNLKNHIQYLSDDKLEGRSTGSKGEELAMKYISEKFKEVGLTPKGTNGFTQEFPIEDGKRIDPSTTFSINSNPLQVNLEFFPLAFSATKSMNGACAFALRESGEPWFIDIKDWLETNKNNAAYNIFDALQKEAAQNAAKGATALIVVNSGNNADNISFNSKDRSASAKIPVIYITSEGYKKYFKDRTALLDIDLNIAISEKRRMGHNVVGYIDNNAQQTVVIGAHYDHLGYGEDGNSLDTGKAIRNGADDNASGIAALIELARLHSKLPRKNNNYMFIAFSGQELGLAGSKYWLENPTIVMNANYMINLDMIGRYDADRKLTIGGFGTSSEWKTILSSSVDNKIQYKLDSTGAGPSDHASFYRKNIPVLFFFTGNHTDYHKASDDYDKINLEGELQVVKLVNRIIDVAESKGKLPFQKTAEIPMPRSALSVSLGVIADNNFVGEGLKLHGVTPKMLADRIGLKSGDTLIQLGDYKINRMPSYIQALSNFKKGDRTVLRIKREKDEKEFSVEF